MLYQKDSAHLFLCFLRLQCKLQMTALIAIDIKCLVCHYFDFWAKVIIFYESLSLLFKNLFFFTKIPFPLDASLD